MADHAADVGLITVDERQHGVRVALVQTTHQVFEFLVVVGHGALLREQSHSESESPPFYPTGMVLASAGFTRARADLFQGLVLPIRCGAPFERTPRTSAGPPDTVPR